MIDHEKIWYISSKQVMLMPPGAVSMSFNEFCHGKCSKSVNLQSSENCLSSNSRNYGKWHDGLAAFEVSYDWNIFIKFNQWNALLKTLKPQSHIQDFYWPFPIKICQKSDQGPVIHGGNLLKFVKFVKTYI